MRTLTYGAAIRRLGSCALVVGFLTVPIAHAVNEPPPEGPAASFDCSRAKKDDERRICASPELRSADKQLAQTYALALERSAADRRAVITGIQREWLSRRPSQCVFNARSIHGPASYESCMSSVYYKQSRLLAYFAGEMPKTEVFGLPASVVSDEELGRILSTLDPAGVPMAALMLSMRVAGGLPYEQRSAAFQKSQTLLRQFAAVKAPRRWPLDMWQAMVCDLPSLRALIAQGIDVTAANEPQLYLTMLQASIQCEGPESLEVLLDSGLAPEKLSEMRFAYFLHALRQHRERGRADEDRWRRAEIALLTRRGWSPGQWGFFDAIDGMVDEPARAETALQRYQNPYGWFYLAMLYLVSEVPTPERDARIDLLIGRARAAIYGPDAVAPAGDSALRRFVSAFVNASSGDAKSDSQETVDVPVAFSIPCRAAVREPSLLMAMEPWSGGMRDAFVPGVSCSEEFRPVPASVDRYLRYIADTYATDACMDGTIRATVGASQRAERAKLRFGPTLYLLSNRWGIPASDDEPPLRSDDPFLLEIQPPIRITKAAFERHLRPLFARAHEDLALHYRTSFGLEESEASLAAHRALAANAYSELACN